MVQQMEEYQRSYFENEGYTIYDSMEEAMEAFGKLYPAQAAAAEESILNDTNCDWVLLNDGSVAVVPEVFNGYAVIENRNIGLPGRPEFMETVLFVGSKHDCAEYEDQKRKEYRDRTRVDCFTVNIAERQRQAKYLEALREYEKTLSDEEKKEIVEKDGKRYFKYILDFKKKYSA